MKIVFWTSDKPREIMLAKALAEGLGKDEFEMRRTAEYGEDEHGNDRKYPGPTPDTDVACAFGVKGRSRQLLDDHLAVGKGFALFDKGFTRSKGEGGHTEYSRIAINGPSPLEYMMRVPRDSDRFHRLGIDMKPRTEGGGHILVCTSSQKYCDFHGLGDVMAHAERIIGRLAKITKRQLVFRPKPSCKISKPISGAAFSSGNSTIAHALRGCHAVVTHGATAAMDAVFAGIPAITLGPSIAQPVCDDLLEKVESPFWPTNSQRMAWASAMAYTQFSTQELRSGGAWSYLREEIVRQAEDRAQSL